MQLYIAVNKAMMIPRFFVGLAPALREWKIWEKKMHQFLKVEIVQSTYKGPPYKISGMVQIVGREQKRETQRP